MVIICSVVNKYIMLCHQGNILDPGVHSQKQYIEKKYPKEDIHPIQVWKMTILTSYMKYNCCMDETLPCQVPASHHDISVQFLTIQNILE